MTYREPQDTALQGWRVMLATMNLATAAAPIKHRSLWLREVLGPTIETQPQLRGDQRADVAIVGGGYVGLWTALRIKEWDPGCDVAIVEQDICGGGASGRNGGMALAYWAKLGSMVRLFGEERALWLARAAEAAVGEIDSFCQTHSVDAHFQQRGWLWCATTDAQRGSWEGALRVFDRLGVEPFERLSASAIAERTGSDQHLEGILDRTAATVQSAALVRGLRRVALERGVRIFEGTPMIGLDRQAPARVRTTHGRLIADKVIIAMNSWAASLPELRRSIVVISSEIIATPPIAERLAEIGWTGGESITDSQQRVDYYRTTRDGRIAFGKGGGSLALGGTDRL